MADDLPKIRGTHIDWWGKCRFHYRMECIERVQPPLLVPRWAVHGWVVHEILRQAVKKSVAATSLWHSVRKSVQNIVCEQTWAVWPGAAVPVVAPFDQAETARILRQLSTWETIAPRLSTVGDTVETEVHFELPMDGWIYTGTMDWRGMRGRHASIVDYKTGMTQTRPRCVPAQVGRYALATNLLNPHLECTHGAVLALESGKTAGMWYPQKWSMRDKMALQRTGEAMVSAADSPSRKCLASPGEHCSYCGYAPACRYAQR